MSPRSGRFSVFFALVLAAALLAGPAQAGRGRWTAFGPPAGAVRILVADPAVAGTLYAVFEAGGLYKSTDFGRTWSWAAVGMPGFEVRALAADPARAGVLWAASEAAVYRTTDGAATWQRRTPAGFRFLDAGEPVPSLDNLVALPGNPPALFLAVADRLWQSTDGGAGWSVAAETPWAITLLAAEPVRGVLYAGSILPGGGLLRSADRGRTWAAVAMPPGGRSIERLAVTAADPSVLYALTGYGLFRSRDRGATWQTVLQLDPAEADRFTAVVVDPKLPARLWVGSFTGFTGLTKTTVRESRDAGATWVERPAGLPEQIVQELVRQRGVPVLYGVGTSTLARLVDGRARWASSFVSGADAGSLVSRVRGTPAEPAVLWVVRGRRLFRSLDGGRRWEGFAEPGAADLQLDPADPDGLYLATDSGLFRSRDRGARWEKLTTQGAAAVALTGGSHVAAGGCGLQSSADGGLTWQEAIPCSDPLPARTRYQVEELTVDPAAPGRIFGFVATYTDSGPPRFVPFLLAYDLRRSDDHGGTWTIVASGTRGLAFDPAHPDRVYTVRGATLLVSDTAGEDWREAGTIGIGGTAWEAGSLLVDPDDSAILYAVDFLRGVLQSTDGGASWRPLNTGLGCGVHCFAFGITAHPTVARRFLIGTSASLKQIDLPR